MAIPRWQNRVSPVFDVAGTLIIFDLAEGREKSRETNSFPPGESVQRIRILRQLEVEVLICGAVSRPLKQALESAGIEVISNICGDVEEVLEAYIRGNLDAECFLGPGSNGHHN